MQNRMEMALTVDVKTDVAADAKTDAAADAGFPAAAAAAETAIRSLAVPERPVPAAAAEHRQRTGNAGHTVRDTETAGTGGTGRAGMMLSGAGMAETEIAAEIKTYKNSNCRKSPGIYRDFSAFVTVLTCWGYLFANRWFCIIYKNMEDYIIIQSIKHTYFCWK